MPVNSHRHNNVIRRFEYMDIGDRHLDGNMDTDKQEDRFFDSDGNTLDVQFPLCCKLLFASHLTLINVL